MKINDVNRIQAMQSYKTNLNKAINEDTPKKIQVDKVEFSATAQEKINAEKEKRIQELKDQIQNGTYKVDSEKIAEKLLATWYKGNDQ